MLCGDLHGRLGQLCDQVTKLHARLDESQRFKAVFCVGEFSSEDMDLDFRPPIPVHFVDAGPAAGDLISASPQGEEVSPNLFFLGHYGVATVAGLKVAFLSGRRHEELFEEEGAVEAKEAKAGSQELNAEEGGAQEVSVDADSLTAKYGSQDPTDGIQLAPKSGRAASDPASSTTADKQSQSWEALKAIEERSKALRSQLFINDRYTPLVVERLCEEMADSGGVDLLLTSEWPAGCMRGVPAAWPQEIENRKLVKTAVKHCSSNPVGELASAAEPKYHAVGLGGVFWRRPPWRLERRGEIVASTGEMKCGVCRMISLGATDGSRPGVPERKRTDKKASDGSVPSSASTPAPQKPEKWLHGLDLDPDSLPADADDATPSPWSENAKIAAMASALEAAPMRAEFDGMDKEERRRWVKKFGVAPTELQKASDRLTKLDEPKEKKEPKRKSIYKVSEKEKKARKTGGDGHLPFAAKERMANNR